MGRGSPQWKEPVEVCWKLPAGGLDLDEVRDEDWRKLPFASLDDGPFFDAEFVAFPVS